MKKRIPLLISFKEDQTKSASVKILQSNIHFEDIWCQIAGNGNAPPLEKYEKRMKKMIQAFSALVKGLRELEWCDPYSLWLRLMAYTPNLPGSCISHTHIDYGQRNYIYRVSSLCNEKNMDIFWLTQLWFEWKKSSFSLKYSKYLYFLSKWGMRVMMIWKKKNTN